MRINKYISSSGFCSRRKADELVEKGKVEINGEKAEKHSQVSKDDVVTISGKQIKLEHKVYYAFNKPKGCLTAVTDEREKTIMDYLDIEERVFPLGRLDKDTEGLLILTNDGDIFNNLMHPRAKVWKKYYLELHKELRKDDLAKIERGIFLEDYNYKTLPAKVEKLKNKTLYISIQEGKKRQIRRVFKALGYSVIYLKRVAVGKITLSNIKLGKYRKLTGKEIEYLKGM